MTKGWIKLYRELLDKPVWLCSTPSQKVILVTMLLMANHKENEWEWQGRPYVCKPGQFITSLESIQLKCGKGVSVANIRTALKRFEKYGFLINKSTKLNRLVTICNWDTYQNQENETNKQPIDSQQTANRQPTTNKNVKNEKNVKNYSAPFSFEQMDILQAKEHNDRVFEEVVNDDHVVAEPLQVST